MGKRETDLIEKCICGCGLDKPALSGWKPDSTVAQSTAKIISDIDHDYSVLFEALMRCVSAKDEYEMRDILQDAFFALRIKDRPALRAK